MTKFVGRRGALGIAKEASRGTPVAPTYWIPFAKMSFVDSVETAPEEQGLGNVGDQDSSYVTFQFGSGSIDAQLYDSALGYILMSLLGAAPSTAGSNPYTHTFTLSQTNQAQSLTLYWSDPDRSYVFPLAVVDSLKVTVTPKGLVEYSVTFKSRKARDFATQTPSFTALGSKFLHQHTQIRTAATVGAVSAASELVVKGLEFTIDRNTINDEVLGTVDPSDVLSQQLSVEGNLNLNLEDDTYRNLMTAGTYKAMEIKFLNGASSSLQLIFPRVSFTEWAPDWSLNEIAKQQINFKANYDAANALQLISTCVLINTKTSY